MHPLLIAFITWTLASLQHVVRLFADLRILWFTFCAFMCLLSMLVKNYQACKNLYFIWYVPSYFETYVIFCLMGIYFLCFLWLPDSFTCASLPLYWNTGTLLFSPPLPLVSNLSVSMILDFVWMTFAFCVWTSVGLEGWFNGLCFLCLFLSFGHVGPLDQHHYVADLCDSFLRGGQWIPSNYRIEIKDLFLFLFFNLRKYFLMRHCQKKPEKVLKPEYKTNSSVYSQVSICTEDLKPTRQPKKYKYIMLPFWQERWDEISKHIVDLILYSLLELTFEYLVGGDILQLCATFPSTLHRQKHSSHMCFSLRSSGDGTSVLRMHTCEKCVHWLILQWRRCGRRPLKHAWPFGVWEKQLVNFGMIMKWWDCRLCERRTCGRRHLVCVHVFYCVWFWHSTASPQH